MTNSKKDFPLLLEGKVKESSERKERRHAKAGSMELMVVNCSKKALFGESVKASLRKVR